MTSKEFFIYGSLCREFPYFNKVQSLAESVQSAYIVGTCYRSQVGFPLVSEQGQDHIPGHCLKLNFSPLSEAFLDEWHGYNPQNSDISLSLKREVSIFCEDGEVVSGFTYFLNPLKKPTHLSRIDGGDWIHDLKNNPPLPQKLTERQRTYVAKLGACAGRDIIPIDMILYRELMNLELIVDKGRRLALSKLGQEVYRYLS